MRKMFRMKYESCNGKCYEYSDVMRIRNLGLDVEGAAAFLRRLLKIHEFSCGNAEIAFRLDVDEELDVFVASMYRYGALDLHADKTALGAMNKLIDGALEYFDSDEYRAFFKKRPSLGHEVCEHGEDRKLINFAIAFSGLDDMQQEQLRNQFNGE